MGLVIRMPESEVRVPEFQSWLWLPIPAACKYGHCKVTVTTHLAGVPATLVKDLG